MITLEQIETSGPPQLVVTVTGITPGLALRVERTWDNGVTWRPVRGAVNVAVAPDVNLFRDWSFPLNTPVTYRTVVAGKASSSDQWVTVTVPSPVAWLQDAFDPAVGIRVGRGPEPSNGLPALGAGSLTSVSLSQAVSTATVLGASEPVQSVGVRQRIGNIPVSILCLAADAPAVRSLVMNAGALLLRSTLHAAVAAVEHVIIPDVAEEALGQGRLVRFSGTASIAAEPAPGVAIPYYTYADVMALVGKVTNASIAAMKLTGAQVAGDPHELVA